MVTCLSHLTLLFSSFIHSEIHLLFNIFCLYVFTFFVDHNAPPFQMLPRFCEDAKNWLDQNPSNVIVVHCKAGKGRTGTMIACYLLYSKVCQSANEAITLFGTKRCHDGKVGFQHLIDCLSHTHTHTITQSHYHTYKKSNSIKSANN
jgi:protein-tyrosine phosphatase